MYLSKSILAAPLNPKVQSMGAFWYIFLCSIHNAFDQLTNSILQNCVDPKQFKLCFLLKLKVPSHKVSAILRDHSYIMQSLVGGEGGQKIPILDYFQY